MDGRFDALCHFRVTGSAPPRPTIAFMFVRPTPSGPADGSTCLQDI
jgi:hypothetical protein